MQKLDGFSEKCEKITYPVETQQYKAGTIQEQVMLEQLLATGFQWNEAITLLAMRENLCENVEMRQRMQDDYRIHFVKWLYEHGIVGEK
jgi:hypothetical protein